MKKITILFFFIHLSLHAYAWWDAGHFLTAMIAYLQLDEQARTRVDELTAVLQRDYPQVNHFIATGAWPDDLKAEGVRAYDAWHYTNMPYNQTGVALPPEQDADVLWAIRESVSILKDDRSRDTDKARFLGFLVHFVGDLHQPLHSTSVHNDQLPSGNAGGNGFYLKGGAWWNLHQLWDAAAGLLDDYNDIRPYGKPKKPLTEEQIARLQQLALDLMKAYPKSKFPAAAELDPDFWALESHKLAIRYGYRGINGQNSRGRDVYLESGGAPSEIYLENAREIARQRLVLSGYRLGQMLNDLFGKPIDTELMAAEKAAVLKVVDQLLEAINTNDPQPARLILLPKAVFYQIRNEDGLPATSGSSVKQFLYQLERKKKAYVERIWDTEISVGNGVATVRAAYDLRIGGALSQCGTKAFTLLKTEGGWMVASVTFEIIEKNCSPSFLGSVQARRE